MEKKEHKKSFWAGYYIALAVAIGGIFYLTNCPKVTYKAVQGETVHGKYFDGFIIDAKAVKDVAENATFGWTPTKKEILALEPALYEYVKQHDNAMLGNNWIMNHLTEYEVQYYGFYRYKVKMLGINFHHETEPIDPNKSWEEGVAGYLKGGYKHFSVIYNAELKKFIDFMVIPPR